ncbi:unnamed protein product [Gongylonema pulchrum]|uniref:Reverse transcriptase domain-containing protein n=1 Tax=Gongylonema pulchrum TaxID=637853 RepID=A0A183DE48_9BILA|nr:unnamed protein product [Gongylonema pulchrum]
MDKPLYRTLQKDPGLIDVLKEALQDALLECLRQSAIHRWRCIIDGTPRKGLFPASIGSFGNMLIVFFLEMIN